MLKKKISLISKQVNKKILLRIIGGITVVGAIVAVIFVAMHNFYNTEPIETDAEETTCQETTTFNYIETTTDIVEEEQEETSEDATEEVPEEELEKFFEEEIATEDQEALELPPRDFDNRVIPYDGKKRTISCYGDSMMQGACSDYVKAVVNGKDITGWTTPYSLQYFTGIRTYNFGVSGENSLEITYRAGGELLYIDRSVTISEDVSAVVALLDSSGNRITRAEYSGYGIEGNNYPNTMYIGGYLCNVENVEDDLVRIKLVKGYAAYNNVTYSNDIEERQQETTGVDISATGNYNETTSTSSNGETGSITETTKETKPQETTTVPETTKVPETTTQIPKIESVMFEAGTVAKSKVSVDHQDDILILEIGSNGGWDSDYRQLIAQYDSIINNSGCKYYIIVGDTDDPGTSIGDNNQTEFDDSGSYVGIGDTSWEAALREAYGEHFFNTRVYLIKNGLSICGLDANRQDLDYYLRGDISPQLRADWTHFNAYGYYAKAQGIYEKGRSLGYW
ncbi:MAG: hypothetical protein Q4F06_06665 [Eubacteriales bacterium]|nr:hypothetical protein [Eubacteriales bacterium]